jgi:hypothetical protein
LIAGECSLGERLPERDLWLLIRRDLTKVPRVRVVADYLIDIFRRERKLLAGCVITFFPSTQSDVRSWH